jgi:branched-chain amino acid transport system permease protein
VRLLLDGRSLVQDRFGADGVWYLVGLGTVAILFALLLPRGLWGAVEAKYNLRLLPVGYRLRGLTSHRP